MNNFFKSLFLFLFGFFFAITIKAQEKYWQQHVDYVIDVKLDDVANALDGTLSIIYTNNSPDTLLDLYFHLWPNAYKIGIQHFAKQLLEDGNSSLYFAEEQERGFISDLEFRVNGNLITWQLDPNHIDIAKLHLDNALLTGDSIIITTSFKVKIPSSRFSRLGHKNQNYQITQWYPKPAVYDKFGWHAMPYLSQGEFYSEFGKFEVNITVPDNYIVAATGNLRNSTELKWLTERSNSKIDFDLPPSSFIESSRNTKTLTYIQDNIHDFAWFASKALNVRKKTFKLPESDREITAWSFFPGSEAKIWEKSTEYIQNTVIHYSKYVGDYPYDVISAIHAPISAGSGMEYPTITVIGNSGMDNLLETVLVHEVGHNWFYGILGSNERKHPWMDEGVNTYFESTYFLKRDPYPEDGENENLMSSIPVLNTLFKVNHLNYIQFYKYLYSLKGTAGTAQKVNLRGEQFESLNYGLVIYAKVGALFYELRNYLGEEIFNKCMGSYYDEFKFKHPYPEDMHRIFESKSGKNLAWFFNEAFNTEKDVDYKIKSLKKEGNIFQLTVKNKSGLNNPFSISQYRKDKIIEENYNEGFRGTNTLQIEIISDADRIKIADKGCIDINERNNSIGTKGLFKKWNKLNFKFLGYPERSDRSTLFYSPAIDYNFYDKFMLGASFYNVFFQTKKFEYIITPMYAFGSSELSGRAQVNLNFIINSKSIHSVTVQNKVRYFNYSKDSFELEKDNPSVEYTKYLRLNPAIVINFKNDNARSSKRAWLTLESKNIYSDKFNYSVVDSIYKKSNTWNHLYSVSYILNDEKTIDPRLLQINAEMSSEHAKIDASVTQKFTYYKERGEASIRFFGGAFLYDNSEVNDYRFRLSGWRGIDDYGIDHNFFGRSERDGIWSQQTVLNDGAFKVPTFLGQTRDWIASINFSASLPGIKFIGAFADLATFSNAGKTIANEEVILFDAGFLINLGDVISVYFPVFKSNDIERSLETNKVNFGEQIRFVINTNKLNFFEFRKAILNN